MLDGVLDGVLDEVATGEAPQLKISSSPSLQIACTNRSLEEQSKCQRRMTSLTMKKPKDTPMILQVIQYSAPTETRQAKTQAPKAVKLKRLG